MVMSSKLTRSFFSTKINSRNLMIKSLNKTELFHYSPNIAGLDANVIILNFLPGSSSISLT